MGDNDKRQALVSFQLVQRIEDVLLSGGVEGGVDSSQTALLMGEGPGDGNALGLSTRKRAGCWRLISSGKRTKAKSSETRSLTSFLDQRGCTRLTARESWVSTQSAGLSLSQDPAAPSARRQARFATDP